MLIVMRSLVWGLSMSGLAALDSRTCPTCAPLDGAVKDSKKDFPSTPVHVNCRCTVVLVDPEDPGAGALRASDQR